MTPIDPIERRRTRRWALAIAAIWLAAAVVIAVDLIDARPTLPTAQGAD